MAAKINLLDKSEIDPPHEKLLRPPTLSEKYGWLKWFFIFVISVGVVDFGIINFLNADNLKKISPQTQQNIAYPTAVPTVDLTQNWQFYKNPNGRFLFKYPSEYTLTENASHDSVQLASSGLPNDINFLITVSFKPVVGNAPLQNLIQQNLTCPKISSQKPIDSTINGVQTAALYADTTCGDKLTSVIYTMNGDRLYIMVIETKSSFSDIKPYTDKILSTLKFWQGNQSQSDEGVVCTEDAKQCPDGSWVGRTGPNCEFVCAQSQDY